MSGNHLAKKKEADLKIDQLLKASTPAAFSEVYDQYAPIIYGLLIRSTSSANEAEELLQKFFLTLWKNRLSYDPSVGTVFSWMLRTLQTICVKIVLLPDSNDTRKPKISPAEERSITPKNPLRP